MKKIFASTVLLSSTVLLLFLYPSTMATESSLQESVISVDSSSNTDVDPDTLKIRFYVENSGINLNDIKTKNDKTVNSAIGEIKKKLNANESIKTIAFRVDNVYSYKNNIRIFQKYQVTNGFEVKLKELSKASEIIKIAMDSGVKRVENLNFYIENSEAVCNDLMKKATVSAKNRASAVASAAGVTLGKPKTINPYCSLNNNYVQPRYLNSMMKSQSLDSVAEGSSAVETIEPGTIGVRAGVNMTYYIK